MWRNVRAAVLNTTLQLLVIYRTSSSFKGCEEKFDDFFLFVLIDETCKC